MDSGSHGARRDSPTRRTTGWLALALVAASCQGAVTGPIDVTTVTAEVKRLDGHLDLAGVLVPAQSVALASRVSGQVKALPVDVGSRVAAGDLLVQLETDTLDAQMRQAKAALESARAAAERARTQVSLAEIERGAAQKDFDAQRALFDKGVASRKQLDDAADRLSAAQGRYAEARGPGLSQARASVDTAAAAIESLQVQIGSAAVTSPLTGTVTNVGAHIGEVVAPGAPVVSVADTSTLKLKGVVGQELLPRLAVGQAAAVTIDIYPTQRYDGQVTSLGPIAVATGEVFPIEVSIHDDGKLMAGISAHATLDLAAHEGIAVPQGAVLEGGGERYVFVVADGLAHRRPVIAGLRTADTVEILRGVSAGDAVAVTNVNALSEGTPVSAR